MAKEEAKIHKTIVKIPASPADEGRNVLVFTLRKNLNWDTQWEAARY